MPRPAVPDPRAGDPALIPAAASVERFRGDLAALTDVPPNAGRRLGVAVSGGGDSLALLLLAAAAWPGAVVAATVDHRLRAAAVAEAAMVAAVCARLGVAHEVLRVPDAFAFDGNMQEQARRVRYALLARWAAGTGPSDTRPKHAAWVATGHQQGDVAETFLMRARRGAGVAGLAAMAARRPLATSPPGTMAATMPATILVRPLLGWSRGELAAVCAAAGIEPASDPSNLDPRFERSRLRALIGAGTDLPVPQLALAARNLRDAEEALAWAADREWHARAQVEAGGTAWFDAGGLPHELKRRLAGRAIDHVHAASPPDPAWRGGGLDRFVRLLDAGRPATLAGAMGRPGPRWRFAPAPPRRSS